MDIERYRKSYNNIKNIIYCCPLVVLILICILLIYFILVGLGYGMSFAMAHNNHNMTTGKCLSSNKEICSYDAFCYYNPDDLSKFYGSCLLGGFLSIMAFFVAILGLIFVITLIVGAFMLIGWILYGIYLGCKEIYESCIYIKILHFADTYGSIQVRDVI